MLNVSTFIRLVGHARRIDRAGRARHARRTLALAAMVGAMMLTAPAVSIVSRAAASQQPTAQQPTAQQPAAAAQRPARPRASQDEFVPVEELPDSEKLPAAPFLIAAYTIVWLVLLGYVWSLWRRLTHVEQELKRAVANETRHA